jgi:hypothetical protein
MSMAHRRQSHEEVKSWYPLADEPISTLTRFPYRLLTKIKRLKHEGNDKIEEAFVLKCQNG